MKMIPPFLSRVLRRTIRGGLGARWQDLQCLLYPPFCTACARPTSLGEHLCEECAEEAARLSWGAPALCPGCSRPFWGAAPLPVVCADCERSRPAFACVVAPRRFAGVVREVVHQFKYDGKRHLRGVVGDWMQEGLQDGRLGNPGAEVLVPVPLHWWKCRLRGFNQAELLARELARRNGIQVLSALKRVRLTSTQTHLAREERRVNVRGAFAARRGSRERLEGRHVLLIDDVLTTGATLDACARVLLECGAASVRALTAARG